MSPVDPRLLPLLACPVDRGPLVSIDHGEALYNPRLRLRYRVEGGVPLLAADDGEVLGEGVEGGVEGFADGGVGGAADAGVGEPRVEVDRGQRG